MRSLAGDVMPGGYHAYTSAFYALELAGTPVGFARSCEGGEVVGRVASNDQGTPPIARKRIQTIVYEPIVLEIGADARPELYDWITDTLQNTQPRRDGRVILLDYQRRAQSELIWTDGLLTEIRFPELDASGRESGAIRLTVTADSITHATGGSSTYSGSLTAGSAKAWNTNGFRLSISGMPNVGQRASWIGPITIRQPYVAPPAPGGGGVTSTPAALDVGDLSVSVSQQHAAELVDWHDDFVVQGNNAPSDERTATIELLNQAGTALLALDLTGIGIYRVSAERQDAGTAGTAGIAAIVRTRADMYCEEVALRVPAAAASTAGAGGSGGTSTSTSTTGGTPAASSAPTGSAEELVVALRAALLGSDPAALLTPARRDPSMIADRLLRSSAVPSDEPETTVDTRVADGRLLGQDWARGHASLEELEEMARVAVGDWDALTLPAAHSLISLLRKHGTLPSELIGDIVLPRDPFIEGVVEGAADAFAEVRPLVRERMRPG
jgi:hypothetical protein